MGKDDIGGGDAVATMVTYSTDGKRSHLRSVVVEDLHRSVVLLPAGSLSILQGKHQHGTACACKVWAQELVLDVTDTTFAVPVEAIVQTRTITNVKISKRKH
jgi:hypothetical protein